MTFLNPALLLGLIASLIPILIHLFNRRKLEKINFSSIAFLKELQKTKIKKIKLKQWILLIIRTLIIALLVLAFSRPAIKSKSFVGGNSTAKTTGVFIIDDSPSMKIVAGQGSYFSIGVNVAGKILDLYQPGDEVYLIFTSNSKKYFKFNSGVTAFNFLGNERVKNTIGNLPGAIVTGMELLNASSNINKELYVISDLQKNDASFGNEEKTAIGKSNDIATYWIDVKPTNVPNISLDKITLENQIFELGKELAVSIKLNANYNGAEAVLSLFVNGSRSAQQKVKFVKAGSSDAKSNFNLKKAGALRIKAEIEDDAFNYDNSLYASVVIPEKIHAGIIYENSEDIKFIKYALQPMDGKTISVDYINSSKFVYTNLNNYDVIIIAGLGKLGNNDKIMSFFDEGKGAIIFPGKSSSVSYIKNLFDKTGIKATVKMTDNPKGLSINAFSKIDAYHPLFKGLLTNDQIKLSSPDIYKYFKISNPEGLRPLITLADGSPFLFESGNSRRILFFNASVDLSWSTFPLKGLFAPLIYRSLFYLSSSDANVNMFLTGERVPVNINGSRAAALKIETPLNTIEKVDLTKVKSKTYYYSNTSEPGVYLFYNGNKLLNAVAVNHNPVESELTYFNTSEFAKVFSGLNPKLSANVLSQTDDIKEIIKRTRYGVELWKYLLMAALILALVEMLVARNTKKEVVSLKNV